MYFRFNLKVSETEQLFLSFESALSNFKKHCVGSSYECITYYTSLQKKKKTTKQTVTTFCHADTQFCITSQLTMIKQLNSKCTWSSAADPTVANLPTFYNVFLALNQHSWHFCSHSLTWAQWQKNLSHPTIPSWVWTKWHSVVGSLLTHERSI